VVLLRAVRAFALRGVTFMVLLMCVAFALPVGGATLLTDKPDYVPGEHVIFSGAGWQPGETIERSILMRPAWILSFGKELFTPRPGWTGHFQTVTSWCRRAFLGQGSSCTLPAGPPC